jgi:hypothetical protein
MITKSGSFRTSVNDHLADSQKVAMLMHPLPCLLLYLCQLISSQTESTLVSVSSDEGSSPCPQGERILNAGGIALSQEATKWLQEQGSKFGDGISLGDLYRNLATERLDAIRAGIVSEHLAKVRLVFLQGYKAFDPAMAAETERAAAEAVEQFRREVGGLPEELRKAVTHAMLESQIEELGSALIGAMARMRVARQSELKGDFATTISLRSFDIRLRAVKEIDSFSCWSSDREAMYLREFALETGQDELPEQMRKEVGAEVERWERWVQKTVHDVFMSTRRETWARVAIVALGAAYVAIARYRESVTGL